MSEPSRTRRSRRQANSRKTSVYVDPETEDDLEISETDEATTPPVPSRITRSTRATRSQPRDVPDTHPTITPPQTRPRKQAPRKRSTNKATATSRSKHAIIKRRVKRKRSQHHAVSTVPVPVIESDGVIPAWQTLPYEILREIFFYAASPQSRSWLLETARKVCRAFAEPALTAYYQSPSLPTSSHLYSFHELLAIPKAQKVVDYNVKVRRLDLDAKALSSVFNGRDPFEIASYLTELPHLTEIYITSDSDRPPYRSHDVVRWRYPEALFESFVTSQRSLKGWRWNWLFSGSGFKDSEKFCNNLIGIHKGPAFCNLQHLEITNFPSEVRPATQTRPVRDTNPEGKRFADTIACLPRLTSLSLESCDMIHSAFLERLPRTLKRLKFLNCLALTSDILQSYLAKDGSCQLEELILNHNAGLDLAFLPGLKSTCPRLRALRMDCHYYSIHHTVNDAEPLFELLLDSDEVPTWPSTLQELELVHLQNLYADGARNLFRSLIESAADLPDLRQLVVQAHLNISWRDRVAFREQWTERLTRVFLRPWIAPDPRLASMKMFRESNKAQHEATTLKPESDVLPSGGKPMTCVEITPRKPTEEYDSDSEPLARRSKRLKVAAASVSDAATPRPGRSESISSSSSSHASDGDESAKPENWRTKPEKFIQCMCNVVDIKIDNQRPREEQYNESHFLDSEASGDEDWTEGNEMLDDNYAW